MIKTERLTIGHIKRNGPIKREKILLASNINLSLKKGLTAIIGHNGAGKSTLIKTLTGNCNPLDGEIYINGLNLKKISKKELAKKIALVLTDPDIAGGLRLHELIALGRTPYTGYFGVLEKEDEYKVQEAMEMVGISHKKDAFVGELSDGERQKGMIARGLVQETPIIIMDEPFSYLDVASRLELMSLIKRLGAEQNKSILFSTHEVGEALKMAENVWMIAQNSVMEGTPDQLIEEGKMDLIFPNSPVKFDKKIKDFILI